MQKNILILASISLFLVGCGTTQKSDSYVAPTKQVKHFPPVGLESEAEIGQPLVSKANLLTYQAIILSNIESADIKQPISNNRWSGRIVVPAGTLTKTIEDANGDFYKAENGYFEGAGTRLAYPVGVFVPKDKNKSAVLYVYHTVMGSTGYDFGKSPVIYKSTITEVWTKDSFKSELIYGGLSQKTISISYREFSDGSARPAFSQDLKYDLADGDIIGFRGARFQVLKATNVGIRYKMIKQLD